MKYNCLTTIHHVGLHVLDSHRSAQFRWSSLDQRWLWGGVMVSFFSLT